MTVYRRGARVTRLATLPPVPPGETVMVSVPGLPLCLDDGSVTARVVAEPGQRGPKATDVRVTLSVERSGEELPAADNAELEAAVVAVIQQKALVEQLERELERLSAFELRARAKDGDESAVPASPIDARLALLSRRQERWRELHTEIEEARVELGRRRRAVKIAKDANERASTAREPRSDELRKCAMVAITGGAQSQATLAVEYRVRGARWAPSYVARIESDGSSATIGVRAVVAQKTGEDWGGVELTLVTAAADTVTSLPVLLSRRIGRRQAAPKTGWRPPPIGTDALFADFERAFGVTAPEAAASHPSFDEEGDDETTAVGGSSYPPPPPGAAPAEVMMSMPAPASATMPPPAYPVAGFAPQEKSAKRRGGRSPAKSISGGLADMLNDLSPEPEAAPASGALAGDVTVRADEILMDYSGLVLAPPHASDRGRLVRQDPYVRYEAELVRERWKISFEVGSAVRDSVQSADAVGKTALPDGHFSPDADFDYSYFAGSRVEVPSDGTFHSIALASASGSCQLRYQVCPRESCDAFRIARLKNPLEAPLLRGPIDVYLGGEFLLQTTAKQTPPGGVIRIGLGVEQAIRVVRNTSFRDDSAGLLGGSRELHHQIRIEAQNHLSRAIELEVRERIPVTRDNEDAIRIEVSAVSPSWQEFEPGDDEPGDGNLKGGYRWIETLAPAAKAEFKSSYAIRIASKHELVGGNRREQ